MDTKILKRTSEHGGPIVLVAGATSLVTVLLGLRSGVPTAAGPTPIVVRPTLPTTTVTAPPPSPRPNPSRSRTSAPSASSGPAGPTGGRFVAAAAQSGGSSARQPGSGAPSGPAPRSPSAP